MFLEFKNIDGKVKWIVTISDWPRLLTNFIDLKTTNLIVYFKEKLSILFDGF